MASESPYDELAALAGGCGILLMQLSAVIPGLLPCLVLALPLVLLLVVLGMAAGLVVGVLVGLSRLVALAWRPVRTG